jgi:hypothetical protein
MPKDQKLEESVPNCARNSIFVKKQRKFETESGCDFSAQNRSPPQSNPRSCLSSSSLNFSSYSAEMVLIIERPMEEEDFWENARILHSVNLHLKRRTVSKHRRFRQFGDFPEFKQSKELYWSATSFVENYGPANGGKLKSFSFLRNQL